MLKKPHYYVMRNLAAQTLSFLKLVRGESDPESEKSIREEEVRRIMRDISRYVRNNGVTAALTFINNYKDLLNENQVESITDAVYQFYAWKDNSGSLMGEWINDIARLDPRFKESSKELLLSFACNGIMDSQSILQLEKMNIFGQNEMRQYLVSILQHIKDNPEDQDWVYRLDTLRGSKHISSKIIDRFMRGLDPMMFAHHFRGENHWISFKEKFVKKEKYNVDDITYLMEMLGQDNVKYKELRHILEGATPPAQRIMLRGLYVAQQVANDDYNESNIQLFIFDETLQPIDADYKPINVHPEVKVARVTTNNKMAFRNEAERIKWGQLFADLNILAYPGTW